VLEKVHFCLDTVHFYPPLHIHRDRSVVACEKNKKMFGNSSRSLCTSQARSWLAFGHGPVATLKAQ
jgi:hypothetical protein